MGFDLDSRVVRGSGCTYAKGAPEGGDKSVFANFRACAAACVVARGVYSTREYVTKSAPMR